MAGGVMFVGGACISGAGVQPWPHGWLGGERMEKLEFDGGTRAPGYITCPALIWSTGTTSTDVVVFLDSSSWCLASFHLAPGENSIFGSGGGGYPRSLRRSHHLGDLHY